MSSKTDKLQAHKHLRATASVHIVNDGPDDIYVQAVTPDTDGPELRLAPGAKTNRFVTGPRGLMVYTKKPL